MDVSKFKDGRVHVRNSGFKGLNPYPMPLEGCVCEYGFSGVTLCFCSLEDNLFETGKYRGKIDRTVNVMGLPWAKYQYHNFRKTIKTSLSFYRRNYE